MTDNLGHRRRSVRLMSKELSATAPAVDKPATKAAKRVVKSNKSQSKKAEPQKSPSPPPIERRKESLMTRILRENNNLLGNVSDKEHNDTSVFDTTADETFNDDHSDSSEMFLFTNDSDSDYDEISKHSKNARFAFQKSPGRRDKRSRTRSLKTGDLPSTSAVTASKSRKSAPKQAEKRKTIVNNEDDKSDQDNESEGHNYFAKFSTAFLTNCLEKMNKANDDRSRTLLDVDLQNCTLSLPASMKPAKEEEQMSSSDDNDDWLDMERIDEAADDKKTSVQVTIRQPVKKTKAQLERERWMNEIRLEIARRRRALFMNMHRMHLLCYIGHLRFHVSAILQEQSTLTTLLAEILPANILAFCPAAIDKAVRMFRPLFKLCSAAEAKKIFAEELQKSLKSKQQESSNRKLRSKKKGVSLEVDEFAYVCTAENYGRYLAALIARKCFASNLDLSMIFFAFCHCILKLRTRICVSFNPMPKMEPQKEEHPNDYTAESSEKTTAAKSTSSTASMKKSRSTVVASSPSKLMQKLRKDAHAIAARRNSTGNAVVKKPPKRRSVAINYCNDSEPLSPVQESPKKPKTSIDLSDIDEDELAQLIPRNYWVEFYDDVDRRWICIDPTFAVVDRPKSIEKRASQPMLYVIVIDNEMGVREVAAKYSSEFMTTKYRRLRIDQTWLNETLRLPLLKADEARAHAEDMQIRTFQLNQEKPVTVSEYKNHPLYALDKDLLKFEAIYPPDLKPLGTIRGYKIYPRDAIVTLQGELNWIKLARNIKAGEKPYKVVKARPKLSIPKEERVQLYLDVYGYWQTEPYVAPPVIDGKIHRNQYGNIYVYQNSMVPKGCVHLKLNGLYNVARRMNLEAVPAVTGWEFTGGRNHPSIEGCVVLEKDAEVLKKAWEKYTTQKAEKEAKKTEEQLWNNWKRLIKGKLLLEKMRVRFK